MYRFLLVGRGIIRRLATDDRRQSFDFGLPTSDFRLQFSTPQSQDDPGYFDSGCQQSQQAAGLRQPWLPNRNKIAARPELAKRLCISVYLRPHHHSIPDLGPKFKKRFTALVTIDKDPRITQTKTEQKADKSELFQGPSRFALLARKIWDLPHKKIPLTPERVYHRAMHGTNDYFSGRLISCLNSAMPLVPYRIMKESKYLTAPIPSKKMPAGIPYILTNEAAERFAFYGSRCILVFFMTHLLKSASGALAPMTAEQSKTWFHLFVSAVYFTPLLGALISDIWLGKYRTILYFSVLYCFGFLALALNHTRLGLGIGLILIAIGSGIIKPCVSANVGDQFGETNKHLIERVFSWFYWAINLGAFASNMLIPELLDRYGPAVGFGVPGAFMVLATIAFWLGRRKFVHIPRAGSAFVKECFSGEGIKAIGKLGIIYIFVAPFWALFDQMDSSWMLQAEKMNRAWLGHTWLPTQIVALNPLMILILIPVFSYVIYPAISKVFPLTALRKIGLGLLLAGTPFVISALIERRIVAGAAPSIGWMVLGYALLTSAEIMVSITCLEFSYTQAPKKMKSFIMAVFLLSISLGNAFTAIVNAVIVNDDGTSKLAGAHYYWFFVGVMFVTALLFIPVARRYPVKNYIQDEAPAESAD